MEKKLINHILIASSLIITLVISIFIYVYLNPESENPKSENKPQEFFCGTKSTPPEKLKGKEIFNVNCAACHRINSKDDILKNALKRFPNDEYFYNYVTNEDSLIKVKDKHSKISNEMFEGDYNHNFKLSQEEVGNLKKYIE